MWYFIRFTLDWVKKTEEQQGSLHPKAWQNLGSCTHCVLCITTASLLVSSKPQSKSPPEPQRPGEKLGPQSRRDSVDSKQSPANDEVPAWPSNLKVRVKVCITFARVPTLNLSYNTFVRYLHFAVRFSLYFSQFWLRTFDHFHWATITWHGSPP